MNLGAPRSTKTLICADREPQTDRTGRLAHRDMHIGRELGARGGEPRSLMPNGYTKHDAWPFPASLPRTRSGPRTCQACLQGSGLLRNGRAVSEALARASFRPGEPGGRESSSGGVPWRIARGRSRYAVLRQEAQTRALGAEHSLKNA